MMRSIIENQSNATSRRKARRDASMVWRRLLPAMSAIVIGALSLIGGCGGDDHKPYGVESRLSMPGDRQLIWAVAPTINLSGERPVDPLLQSDIVYSELQQVNGLTIIPVDRVTEIYLALKIDKVESQSQANLVCDLLGCDGLVVPTVTEYDPYNPPKLGAALQLFTKPADYARPADVDPRELARAATPPPDAPTDSPGGVVQSVGMFDAADGSVRQDLMMYAAGRNDPNGPLAANEYLLDMDRYCGFVYHTLIAEMLASPAFRAKG
jgi:hypothetical protein